MELEDPRREWPLDLASIGSWRTTLTVGVITVILGLIVSFHPTTSLHVIAVLLGVPMILSGLLHLIRTYRGTESNRVWMGITGLLLIGLGITLIRGLHLTVAIVGFVIAIGWIVQGLSALAVALSGDTDEGRDWWFSFGVFNLIGGIVILAVPVESVAALAVLLGIWFIVQGALEILDALVVRHMIAKITIVGPLNPVNPASR
jgi:uncharacterized membrane protein HdeD (DUF308 family)